MQPFAVAEALDVTDDDHPFHIARGMGLATGKFVLQHREKLSAYILEKGHGACRMLRPEAERTPRAMGERGDIVRTLQRLFAGRKTESGSLTAV